MFNDLNKYLVLKIAKLSGNLNNLRRTNSFLRKTLTKMGSVEELANHVDPKHKLEYVARFLPEEHLGNMIHNKKLTRSDMTTLYSYGSLETIEKLCLTHLFDPCHWKDVCKNRLDVVKFLVQIGYVEHLSTLFSEACKAGRLDIVKYLNKIGIWMCETDIISCLFSAILHSTAIAIWMCNNMNVVIVPGHIRFCQSKPGLKKLLKMNFNNLPNNR
jgi:hypothetical protein